MCFDTPDPPLTGPRPNYPRNPGGGGGSRTEDAPQGVPPEAGCSAQGSITASIGLFGDVKAKLNGAFSLQASLNLLKFNIPIVGPEAGPRPAGMALFPITQSVGISIGLFEWSFGFVAQRRSDHGDISGKWNFGAKFENVNVSSEGVTLELGGGMFVGVDTSISILSPAC